MDAGRLLRAARRARRLSQRELAEYAGVPRSTVDRIEAGRTDPRLSTVTALSDAVALELVLVDQFGSVVDVENDELFDRTYRRFPAHLESAPVTAWGSDDWWGWGRIAWSFSDPAVPKATYFLRPRPGTDRHRRRLAYGWDDAT